MVKRIIITLLFALLTNNICYAGWTDLLQNTVDTFNSSNETYRDPYKNLSKYRNPYMAENSNPVVIELFAGLKSDSSIIEVVNTFKKFNSVTSIKLGYDDCEYYSHACYKKSTEIDFKNLSEDKIYETLANFLSTSKFQEIELYNAKIDIPKRKLHITVQKIYKDGIPYGVSIDFEPCAGYLYLYPSKVYQDSNGTAYPYIITNIVVGSFNDMSTQNIVREKYGKSHIEHEYSNMEYYLGVNDKYQKLLNKWHIEENKKLDSGIKF